MDRDPCENSTTSTIESNEPQSAETRQRETDNETADTTEAPGVADTLWDKAYDALNKEEDSKIALYEDLLTRVVVRRKPASHAYRTLV